MEAAKQESSTITREATAKAQGESEKILADARAEGQVTVSNAQAEEQDILRQAQRESVAVVHASQARAENVESNARLRAEFIIRQMNQVVYDGIHRAVMQTCQELLPDLDNIAVYQLEHPAPEQNEGATAALIEAKDPTTQIGQSSSGETRSTTQPSTRRKARSSTERQGRG